MPGLNLELMIKPIISAIVPRKTITIYVYTGQTVYSDGSVIADYNIFLINNAQVQLSSRRTLEHINNIDMTKIYKDFRIQSASLTGLNRNIGSAGDYIEMDGKQYKIVALPENFETGWIWVVGCESTERGN